MRKEYGGRERVLNNKSPNLIIEVLIKHTVSILVEP